MSVRVIFEVYCPTASFEEVCLVGSTPELGAWDSTKAVPLRTAERSYPVWRTSELLLSRKAAEVVQYKYIKLGSGSIAQWEVGPNRILDLQCLSDTMVNCVEDVTLDIDEDLARRSQGARIRFQESGLLAKSQAASLATSRPASSVPSPLRTSAGQTPVEKSPHGIHELEAVLRELMELELMHLAGHAHVQRAVFAVRSAIEAERSGPRQLRQRFGGCTFPACSLLMVPLLPMIVAAVILWRAPSTRPPLCPYRGPGARGAAAATCALPARPARPPPRAAARPPGRAAAAAAARAARLAARRGGARLPPPAAARGAPRRAPAGGAPGGAPVGGAPGGGA